MIYKVMKDNLNVRKGPGMQYDSIGTLAKDIQIESNVNQDNWAKHSSGWSHMDYLSKDKNQSSNGALHKMKSSDKIKAKNISNVLYDSSGVKIKQLNGIHGLPHQFLNNSDMRVGDSDYGRTFQDKILSDMPSMLMTVGRPDFMSGVDNNTKDNLDTYLSENYKELDKDKDSDTTLQEILKGTKSRYFKFAESMTEYYAYVNSLCKYSALYLGISNLESPFDGKLYKDINWQKNISDSLYNFFDGDKNFTSFFIDGASQISESASNSTTESMLAQKTASVSAAGREMKFLFGVAGGGTREEKGGKENNEDVKANNGSSNPNMLLNRLGSGYKTVVQNGANLVFPEVWGDSSFSKSYNVDIKLRSPYGDKESIFLNILVPFYHILALSLPRVYETNGIQSPFLVRAFCRGMFNCDMGIVESLSFKKGGQDGWSIDGIPLEIDLSLTIKELHQSLAISTDNPSIDGNGPTIMMENLTLLDFIATTSGVNINKANIERKLDTYLAAASGVLDAPTTVFSGMYEDMVNALRNLAK